MSNTSQAAGSNGGSASGGSGRGGSGADLRVAVIGLGTAGSMALWALSRTPGVQAIGVEQFGLGHSYGGFSGESRLFRNAYQEGEMYVSLLRRARQLWDELSLASGRMLFHQFGVLTVNTLDAEPMQRLLESVRDFDLPHEMLSAEELRERYPQLDIREDEIGVLDPEGGALRPEMAVASALEEAREAGAEIRDHCPVLGISEQADGVTVSTAQGDILVDRVIVTAGSWSTILVPELEELIEVRRLVLTWFLPKDAADFAPDRFPCFIRDRDGFHVFGAPIVDGYSVKASGDSSWGRIETDRPEEMELRMPAEDITAYGVGVTALLPGLNPEPVRYSVHPEGFAAGKVPILDRRGKVVVVAGLSGHGFKLAPVYGEMAAELAVSGDAELMRPEFRIDAHPPV